MLTNFKEDKKMPIDDEAYAMRIEEPSGTSGGKWWIIGLISLIILIGIIIFIIYPKTEEQPLIAESEPVPSSEQPAKESQSASVSVDKRDEDLSSETTPEKEPTKSTALVPPPQTSFQIPPKLVVYYAFDSFTPFDYEMEEISGFANAIRDFAGTVKIEGHTDSVGTDAYNEILSDKRASRIKSIFTEMLADSVITYEIAAYGEKKPATTVDTEEGRRLNRRAEVFFEPN